MNSNPISSRGPLEKRSSDNSFAPRTSKAQALGKATFKPLFLVYEFLSTVYGAVLDAVLLLYRQSCTSLSDLLRCNGFAVFCRTVRRTPVVLVKGSVHLRRNVYRRRDLREEFYGMRALRARRLDDYPLVGIRTMRLRLCVVFVFCACAGYLRADAPRIECPANSTLNCRQAVFPVARSLEEFEQQGGLVICDDSFVSDFRCSAQRIRQLAPKISEITRYYTATTFQLEQSTALQSIVVDESRAMCSALCQDLTKQSHDKVLGGGEERLIALEEMFVPFGDIDSCAPLLPTKNYVLHLGYAKIAELDPSMFDAGFEDNSGELWVRVEPSSLSILDAGLHQVFLQAEDAAGNSARSLAYVYLVLDDSSSQQQVEVDEVLPQGKVDVDSAQHDNFYELPNERLFSTGSDSSAFADVPPALACGLAPNPFHEKTTLLWNTVECDGCLKSSEQQVCCNAPTSAPAATASISVFTLDGKCVCTCEAIVGREYTFGEGLNPGVYLVHVECGMRQWTTLCTKCP